MLAHREKKEKTSIVTRPISKPAAEWEFENGAKFGDCLITN
jgi:hypothetical protein